MPEPWYPPAVRDPGVNAGYRAGRNRMQLCVCHYTVGRDSSAIGRRGYFHWLVGRDGTVTQYAETDATTWHAGTANHWGPGIEVEYLPGTDAELWTPAQEAATGALCDWLKGQGIPDAFYDGPRIDPSGFSGFLTHRSVQQVDGHSDWWPYLPTAAPEPTPTPGDATDMWALLALFPDQTSTYLCGVGSAILHDVYGKQGAHGLPEDQLKFIGWDPSGITTKVVTSHTIELLRDLWPNVGDQG